MKLIDKYNDKGINKHTVWIFEENNFPSSLSRKICINKNHDVHGDNYYIFEKTGRGEGCRTIWYPSLKRAKEEVERLFKTGDDVKTGLDFNLCNKCKNHFSFGTDEYKKSKDFVCGEMKERYAQ